MKILWERDDLREQAEPLAIVPLPKQMLRILVVDDDRDNAVTLSFLFKMWGHDVQCCHDGHTALIQIETFQPDVFLLDIAMPRMSGYVLLEKLRKLPALQHAVYIAITGHCDAAHRAHGVACGFDHHLAKPADLGELKSLLADCANKIAGRHQALLN